MEALKDIVRRLDGEDRIGFAVTRQQQRRIESIEVVRELREEQKQELAFNSRPFVLCGIPIRRPPGGTVKYVRRNGRFLLEVIGHPDFGLPFGQDRLIPLWVATIAVRQRSRIIEFRSAAEILEFFDLPRDGPHYRRLVDGFKRVFTSSIYFGTESRAGRGELWDYRRFHFFDRMKVWYSNGSCLESDLAQPRGNAIVLSESFWQEIQAHPIPVDVTVVRALTNNPGCLDLYMWLAWRCFNARRAEEVPLFGTSGLAAQLGVGDYTRTRNFRKRFREWLAVVRIYWPECPARLMADGDALGIAPARAILGR